MDLMKRYLPGKDKESEDRESQPLLGAKEEQTTVKRCRDTDGIHSWLIALWIFLVNFAVVGHTRASGILFVDFMNIFHIDRKTAASPYSVQQSVGMFCGPVVGIVGQMFGLTAVAVIGCVIAAISCGAVFFADDIWLITITWGGLLGVGLAFASTIDVVLIEQYFVKYRSSAFSFAQSGACVGAFVFPILLDVLINRYGIRGAFLILGGILLNVVPIALLFQEKKKPELSEDEENMVSRSKPKLYNSFSEQETSLDTSFTSYSTSEFEEGRRVNSDLFEDQGSAQKTPTSLKVRAEVNEPNLKSSASKADSTKDNKHDLNESQNGETSFSRAISMIGSEIEALSKSMASEEDGFSTKGAAADSKGTAEVTSDAGSKSAVIDEGSKAVKKISEGLTKTSLNILDEAKDKSKISTNVIADAGREWAGTGEDGKVTTVVEGSKTIKNITDDMIKDSFNILGVTGDAKEQIEGPERSRITSSVVSSTPSTKVVESIVAETGGVKEKGANKDRSTEKSVTGHNIGTGAISKISAKVEGAEGVKQIEKAYKVVSQTPIEIAEKIISKEVEVVHSTKSAKKRRSGRPDVYKKVRRKRIVRSSSLENKSTTGNDYGINFNFLHENTDLVLDLLTNKIPIGDEEMMPSSNEITQNDLESPDIEFISQELQKIEIQFQRPQQEVETFLSGIRDKLEKFQQQLDNDRGQILKEKKLNLDGKELSYKDIRNTTIRRSSCTIEIFEYTCEIPVELYIPIKLQELYDRSSSHILTYYSNNERISIVLRQLRKLHEVFSGEKCGYAKDKRPSHLLESTTFSGIVKSGAGAYDPSERPPSTFWDHIKIALKIHFNPMFFLTCLCRCLHVLTFLPVVMIVVDFAMDRGLEKSQGIYAILALSGGDLLGRLKGGLISDLVCCRDVTYMVIGLIMQGVITAMLPHATGIVVLPALLLFGITQGCVFVRQPLVLTKYVKPHEKRIGLGSLNFLPGLVGLFVPYIIGYTRDKLGSYDMLFYINGGLTVFVGLLWLLEPLLRRFAPAHGHSQNMS